MSIEKQFEESVESPWLLCSDFVGKEQFFCSGFRPRRRCLISNPILSKKKILNYSHGWLLLKSEVSKFMLFNPKTRDTIFLPLILPKPNQAIRTGILWLPPENPKSMVVMFDFGRSTILHCYLHKKQWVETSYRRRAAEIAPDGRNFPVLYRQSICNGRLYALLMSRPYQVVEIDVVEQTGLIQIEPLGSEVPYTMDSYKPEWWLVGSEGELFVINVALGGVNSAEISDAGVFKWDFEQQQWTRVNGSDIKDRAFFICGDYQPISISPATVGGQRFGGGRVHFVIDGWPSCETLFSFDVEELSLTVSIPSKSFVPILWVMMSDLREGTEVTKGKKKTSNKKSYSHPPDPKPEFAEFYNLPDDIIEAVSKKLTPMDYLNFRATCKTCYGLAPAIKWRESSLARQRPHSLLPMLMFSKSYLARTHHFLDPKFSNTFTIINHESLANAYAKILHSKDGWVLMNKDETFFFFYNPFTKEIVEIPEAPRGMFPCTAFCFSHAPSSPECVVVGVAFRMILYFSMSRQQWNALTHDDIGKLPDDSIIHNTPVFFRGALYFLGTEGSLSRVTLEEPNLTTFDRLHCPCEDFCQNFLLEDWDGRLASVFINDALTELQIFTLNEKTFVWEEVSRLGKYSLFLSRHSAFFYVTNSPEMEDKVYLSRIHGEDNVVFYCLRTRKYGYTTNKRRIESFVGTKEYLCSCWIQSLLC